MMNSVISIVLLLVVIGVIACCIMQVRKYKSEKEKNAIDKGLIAYLITNSALIGWLVYRKNNNNDRL